MIGTAIATLIAGLAAGGSSVAGAKIASNAAKRGSADVVAASREAQAFAEKQDALERAQYNQEYSRQTGLEDAHLARQQGLRDAMGAERASLAGMRPPAPTAPPSQGPRRAPPMPPGWKPGDQIGPLPPTARPAPPQQRQWRTLRDFGPTAPAHPRMGAY